MKQSVACLVVFAVVLSGLPALAEGEGKPESTQGNLPYEYHSPMLAGLLSIVPGAGQVYNGEYVTGGVYFAVTGGLYLAAAAYAGAFRPGVKMHLSYESIFLLAAAGGLHLVSVFDATLEASRMNDNLDRWRVSYDPVGRSFAFAFHTTF